MSTGPKRRRSGARTTPDECGTGSPDGAARSRADEAPARLRIPPSAAGWPPLNMKPPDFTPSRHRDRDDNPPIVSSAEAVTHDSRTLTPLLYRRAVLPGSACAKFRRVAAGANHPDGRRSDRTTRPVAHLHPPLVTGGVAGERPRATPDPASECVPPPMRHAAAPAGAVLTAPD
jgi:hypothetical protein